MKKLSSRERVIKFSRLVESRDTRLLSLAFRDSKELSEDSKREGMSVNEFLLRMRVSSFLFSLKANCWMEAMLE